MNEDNIYKDFLVTILVKYTKYTEILTSVTPTYVTEYLTLKY